MRMLSLLLIGGVLAACAAADQNPPPGHPTPAPTSTRVFGAGNFADSKALTSDNVREGCPAQGNAKPNSVKALNILKNRVIAPRDDELDASVSLSALLRPGDDEERWDELKGGVVVGLVYDTKIGGVETTNCKATDPADRDTHIELVLGRAQDGPTMRVIVEVTPRWRDKMRSQGVDWSTEALKTQLIGKWIRVKGWLLFDQEHVNQAENTNPGNDRNWRATVWEIHPITEIDVLTGGPH